MKIVLAFDSFKGSLSAPEACAIARRALEESIPGCRVIEKPMADGGEGTARAVMAALGGTWQPVRAMGPWPDQSVEAGYAWFADRRMALVETAAASGLPLLDPARRNPLKTTTFGTGELVRAAVLAGARTVQLAAGGSATVDGGVGAAMALGWQFLDLAGRSIGSGGEALMRIAEIRPPASPWSFECEVLTDVTNPLCGPNGAARVFGPQKGATPAMVETLEKALEHLAEKIEENRGLRLRDRPGAGAAGGLAAGAVAFFNARLVPGIDRVMTLSGVDEALAGADWVITGEGSFDEQSLQGKVVSGVLRRALENKVKVAVLAGSVRLDEPSWRDAGISSALSLRAEGMTTEEAISRSRELLDARVRQLIKTFISRIF